MTLPLTGVLSDNQSITASGSTLLLQPDNVQLAVRIGGIWVVDADPTVSVDLASRIFCLLHENYYLKQGSPEYLLEALTETDWGYSKANHVTTVSVIDPYSQGEVGVDIYKDEISGAMFGVDSSYLENYEDGNVLVVEPINNKVIELVE